MCFCTFGFASQNCTTSHMWPYVPDMFQRFTLQSTGKTYQSVRVSFIPVQLLTALCVHFFLSTFLLIPTTSIPCPPPRCSLHPCFYCCHKSPPTLPFSRLFSLFSSLPFVSHSLLSLWGSARAATLYSAAAAESRENSFSRSRSSSVSSIDRDTKEAITTLQFGESYGRKTDALPTPCLWVGTSLGVVLLVPMSIPTEEEERMEEAVTFGPSGKPQDKDLFCSLSVPLVVNNT